MEDLSDREKCIISLTRLIGRLNRQLSREYRKIGDAYAIGNIQYRAIILSKMDELFEGDKYELQYKKMVEISKQLKKEPIRPIIRNLKVDESYTYPASRMCAVKLVCSQISVMENKVFKTKLEKPMFHVTRVK